MQNQADQVEIKNVHREPHPFIGVPHIPQFTGKTIAFVGRISELDSTTMTMETADSKCVSALTLNAVQNYK